MRHNDVMGEVANESQPSDSGVMSLLLDPVIPWGIEDLEREIGCRIKTADSLARLIGAGLVKKIGDDIVIATRAAQVASTLELS